MLRVYIHGIPGLGETRQIAMAAEAGVANKANAPLYIEKRGKFPEARDEAIKSLRKGDTLGVARLAILATNRKDLRLVLAGLAKAGMSIRELATGRTLAMPSDWPDAVLDAVHYWSMRNRSFGEDTAAEAGRKGGKASAKARRKARMPRTQAAAIWLDKRLTAQQALDAINADETFTVKYSTTTAYRVLGPRWKRP